MPVLPISRNQLDRLGDRLRDAQEPAADDFDLLEVVLGVYDEALQAVRTRLLDLGFYPTVRLKTTGTIVDKLRRDRSSSLKTIQDLAGARVVLAGGLSDQDAAVQSIRDACSDLSPTLTVIDRRTDPRAGYRAVHIILKIDSIPVEIQLRTELQDLWAQIFERLADVWGRQIRYGGSPDPDGADPASQATRQAGVSQMMEISKLMAQHETMRAQVDAMELPDPTLSEEDTPPELREVRSTYREFLAREAQLDAGLRTLLASVADRIEMEASRR